MVNKSEILYVQNEISQAWMRFDEAKDELQIDSAIKAIESLGKIHTYLIKKARQEGVFDDTRDSKNNSRVFNSSSNIFSRMAIISSI